MAGLHLFAYGSILTGTGQRSLARTLRELVEDLGPGYVRARLYDLGDYPGAVPSTNPGDRVQGRLLRLRAPLSALSRLDRYERYDPRAEAASEFVRRPVEVALPGRPGPVTAYVYYYNRPARHRPRVLPADWPAWLRRRRGAASPGA